MLPISKHKWTPRLTAIGVWSLVALCAWYWSFRWTVAPDKLPVSAISSSAGFQTDSGTISRLLGAKSAEKAPAVAINMSSRFMLLGVLAENSGAGAALIAVDGKPAKPFRVGSEVITGYTLESVKSRVATLKSGSDNASKVVLEMAPLKK